MLDKITTCQNCGVVFDALITTAKKDDVMVVICPLCKSEYEIKKYQVWNSK